MTTGFVNCLGLSATIPVNKGGSGDSSLTTYAPLCGGTSSTGSLQQATAGMSTSGYVLTSTGTGSLPTWQAVGGGGGASSVTTQSFTGAGTYTYTPTAGMVYCLIILSGAGGGGGGSTGGVSTVSAAGGGGAGSSVAQYFNAAAIGASQTIVLGAGGAGGTAGGGTGGNGGSTTMTGLSLSYSGGLGGSGATASTHAVTLTAGGQYQLASYGISTLTPATLIGGAGGTVDALWLQGYGGVTTYGDGIGSQGTNGGGGSGACSLTTSYAGGPGGDGCVLIYEFIS